MKQYLSLMNALGCDDNNKNDFDIMKKSYNLNESITFSDIKANQTTPSLTLENIIDSLNISEDLKQLIKNGSKNKALLPYKIHFIKAELLNKYTLVEISKFLSTTPYALRKFKDYHKISI